MSIKNAVTSKDSIVILQSLITQLSQHAAEPAGSSSDFPGDH